MAAHFDSPFLVFALALTWQGLAAYVGDVLRTRAHAFTDGARPAHPAAAVAISGTNDVLNSKGYTEGGWWNRIPVGAWAMMALMAFFCNFLVGYGERRKGELFLFILPVVVPIAFFLIADLDSPHGGVIHVHPHNLLAAAQSMKPP